MSVYARFPLNQSQKQIRLVTIQPSMYLSSPIQCNLSAVSLTNPPHYEALSYRWGDEKIRSTIQLENEEFSITTSLKEALVRLRDQTRPMKYWIDQICINQGDASEQNGQVPLMGEVYSKAGIVKAWLGEEAEESEKAFRLSERWYNTTKMFNSLFREVAPRNRQQAVLFVRMAGPIVVDVSNLQAFVQLILREYWRRVWMIQEIGRARQCIVMSGPNKTDLKSLIAMSELIADFDREFFQGVFDRGVSQFYQIIHSTRFLLSFTQASDWYIAVPNNPDVVTVETILGATGNFGHKKPHDRIYGLLGVHVFRDLNVTVDYTRPPERAFMELAKELLDQRSSLRWLGLLSKRRQVGSESELQLPSWMPEFKGISNLRVCHDTAESIAERFWRPQASIDLETGTLTAKGVLWDKVQSVHFEEGIDGWSNAYPAPCKRILCWLMAAAQRCQHIYPTGISRLQAFTRTVFANYQVDEFQGFAIALTEMIFDLCRQEWEHISRSQGLGRDNIRDVRNICWVSGLCASNGPHETILQSFWGSSTPVLADGWVFPDHPLHGPDPRGNHTFVDTIVQRVAGDQTRFIVTEGGYMAFGSCDMRRGDLICCLYGSTVPLIIRPENGHYIVVGPCFLYGIMQGEAWREGIDVRTFKFR